AVALTQGELAGQLSVVRDEQQRVKLLVELERDVLGLTRSERGPGPRAVRPLRDVEEPGDKTVHRRATARVPRPGREKRAADVVRVARPDKGQDLVVGDDRHHVLAGARRRAVEGVRDTATDLVGLVVVQTESRPRRPSRAHLVR